MSDVFQQLVNATEDLGLYDDWGNPLDDTAQASENIKLNICIHCELHITFRLDGNDEYDWVAHLGSSKCPVSNSGRHHPESPVAGIDY